MAPQENDALIEKNDIPCPLELHRETVRPEWIDHNGHMNVAYYLLAFDEASGPLLDYLGLTWEYRQRNNCVTFVGDAHVTYRREVLEGAPLRFETRVIDCDEKRVHYWHEMYHAEEGFLSATAELITLHIDARVRRVAPMPAEMVAWICRVRDAHRRLPLPADLGRVIRVKGGLGLPSSHPASSDVPDSKSGDTSGKLPDNQPTTSPTPT